MQFEDRYYSIKVKAKVKKLPNGVLVYEPPEFIKPYIVQILGKEVDKQGGVWLKCVIRVVVPKKEKSKG